MNDSNEQTPCQCMGDTHCPYLAELLDAVTAERDNWRMSANKAGEEHLEERQELVTEVERLRAVVRRLYAAECQRQIAHVNRHPHYTGQGEEAITAKLTAEMNKDLGLEP